METGMRPYASRCSSIIALAVAFVALIGLGLGTAARADAKAKKDIQQKIKEAMENYDLLEYEEAKKLLTQALNAGKKAKMDADPVMAQVHLSLGIVYFAGLQDADSAKLSFLSAVEIDPKVEIEAAYKTADMASLLEEARGEAGVAVGGGGDDGGGDDGGVDCSSVAGVQHEIVDSASGGMDRRLEAYVGADVGAAKVAIMYRPQGAADFAEAKMSKKGDCAWYGAIPGEALRGELLHYYIAAFNGAGKMIAGKGSSSSPNIIEISGAAAGGGGGSSDGDDENPFGPKGPKGGGGGDGGSIGGGITIGPNKPSKVFFNIAVGSGAAFVTGKTEQKNNDVECCFAPALLHVFPELGYYISEKTSIGVAFRLGFPIGANIAGHATAAPAGLIRLRQSLGQGQTGLHVSGSIGGGIIRNTIKLTEAAEGMDTDIVAIGPMLVGAGVGYAAALGGPIKFVAEVNALAGIPVKKEIGGEVKSRMTFGVEFDFNLGLMFGF